VIALDSNILVRYFAQDDSKQSPLAARLIESRTAQEPGWIGIPVLIEFLWVLASSFKVKQAGIIEVLERLLASNVFMLEHEDLVRRSLSLYRTGRAQFADCLIAVSASDAGCTRIVTFDRIAARDARMELLA
jgi:predicted nucleic-acid-binding protein